MSGCCGSGPVIVSGAAPMPRVDVETVLLCDVLPDGSVAGLALIEPVYDTITGDRVGTRTVDPVTGAPYVPAGTLGPCGSATEQCARQISIRTRCDDADGDGTGEITYTEVWALDPCTGEDPALLGTFLDGDFADPYTPVAPVDCPSAETSADTPVVLGQVCYDAGAGEIRTAAVLKYAACGDPAVTYLDVETGATVAAPAFAPCAAPEQRAELLCDVAADGVSTPFLRTFTIDGATTYADTELDGVTGYAPTGTVGVCLPGGCSSPTTPTATVGLCLVDGTPIAVTVVRDCDGVTTSEGWINLSTGAFSAGAPPVGTVACGDSQSIQVSGTFCDVDAGGDVVGLVLVEYEYAADGTIDNVRLVDATTGATYVPTGTVTVCPAGVEQPEQDAVVLCDTATDGTVTPFVRDYRRDELGAVTGHSDYSLDGTAYAPTGTVGVCGPESCTRTETVLLCDTSGAGAVTSFLRTFAFDCEGAITTATDSTLTGTAYAVTGTVGVCASVPAVDVETFPLCVVNPDGSVVQYVREEVVYDAAGTRTASRYVDAVDGSPVAIPGGATLSVCPTLNCAKTVLERCGCDDTNADGIAEESYTELWAVDPCNGEEPVLLGTYLDGDLTQPYTPIAPVDCTGSEALSADPLLLCDSGVAFLRHVRYDGGGTPLAVIDTELDGTTAYAVTGTVGTCAPGATADALVSTGLNRLNAAGTFDVKATAPGLQSATVTVLTGTAQVTTSSGTVTIPAGLSLTWSVADTDDSSLSALSVTVTAGSDVITNYTSKSGVSG